MKSLSAVSISPHIGKCSICLILGLIMKNQGLNVGYIRPIGDSPIIVDGVRADKNALFIAQALKAPEKLDVPIDLLCPILVDSKIVGHVLEGTGGAFLGSVEGAMEEKIVSAFSKISLGKDIVLSCSIGSLSTGSLINLPVPRQAELIDAKMLLVVKYESDSDVEDLFFFSQLLKPGVIGSMFNHVPKEKVGFIRETIIPYLEEKGVPVLGVIPEDEILNSTTARELADELGGKVLCCHGRANELIHNFMVGAMDVRSAFQYFRDMHDKAVITGGDRPDIQLAALQTSTRCLILTGNLHPSPVIVDRAREIGVPVILVKDDTLTTIGKVRGVLRDLASCGNKKMEHAKGLFEQNVDLDRLYTLMGL